MFSSLLTIFSIITGLTDYLTVAAAAAAVVVLIATPTIVVVALER